MPWGRVKGFLRHRESKTFIVERVWEAVEKMLGMAQPATVEESPSEIERLCACGCGRGFEPRRKDHQYFGQACRERSMQRKTVPIRVPISEAGKIKARITHQNARKSVVQQFPATESRGLTVQRQVVLLAALWLKNRLSEEQRK